MKKTSLTKAIPPKLKEELSEDEFMQKCCLQSSECRGKIQWHHNLTYAGKRVNEKGGILPVCEEHHRRESMFRKQLNAIMYKRMTDEERSKYPKKNWHD